MTTPVANWLPYLRPTLRRGNDQHSRLATTVNAQQKWSVKLLLQAGATDLLPKQPQGVEMTVRLRNLIQLGAAVRMLSKRAEHLAAKLPPQRKSSASARRSSCGSRPRSNTATPHRGAHGAGCPIQPPPRRSTRPPARICRDNLSGDPLHDVGMVAIPDQARQADQGGVPAT
jgi:putative two-component system response regulator